MLIMCAIQNIKSVDYVRNLQIKKDLWKTSALKNNDMLILTYVTDVWPIDLLAMLLEVVSN